MKETGKGWKDIVRKMRTGFRELLNKMKELKKSRDGKRSEARMSVESDAI